MLHQNIIISKNKYRRTIDCAQGQQLLINNKQLSFTSLFTFNSLVCEHFLALVQTLCTAESVCQVHLTKDISPPSLKQIKESSLTTVSTRSSITSNSADHVLQRLKDSDSNMFWFFFLFGLALGAESPAEEHPVRLQRGSCPLFWFGFNGRCYKYVATPLTWADAELSCVSQGGNLVSIHSVEEQNFIRTLIKNFDHSERPTWIGLSDIHKEGSWMWSDGCRVKFVYWAPGEPNNYRGNENCAHVNFAPYQKWNDVACSYSYPSVCASRIFCS